MSKNGLDDLIKDLEQMQKNVKELNGEKTLQFDELFNYEFMCTNTEFENIYDLLDHFGISYETQEEFEALDKMILDNAVLKSTRFSSWEEMLGEASEEYATKQLFKGLNF